MKRFSKYIAGAALLAAIMTHSASAVDQAAAAGHLAAISTLSTQAKANLSVAALGGDVEAVAEMNSRSDAIDAAMAEAQGAFSAIEKEMLAGNEDAAQSAMNDLQDSLKKAQDAFKGVIPDDLAEAVRNMKKNSGGGPASPYDPPNMYDVPWTSDTMRGFYQSHWGNLFAAGRSSGDKDGTPE